MSGTLHSPGVAVSFSRTAAVPRIAGRIVLVRSRPTSTPVRAEAATVETLSVLVAVTRTASLEPMSAVPLT